MKFSTLAVCLAVPLAVGGCASFPCTTGYLDELRTATPAGSPFTKALSKEYLALAESEKKQDDWWNQQIFAYKGLDAARGVAVLPESPERWYIDGDETVSALNTSRARLLQALSSSATTRSPVLTATAQVKYDCWVAQAELKTKSVCRDDFLAAMDAIEARNKAPSAAEKQETVAPQRNVSELFFNFNSAKLTPEARKSIASIAGAAKTAGYPAIRLEGHTDSVGSAGYNMKLSLRRAEAVKKALIAAGVPADRIATVGLGKDNLLVPTADQVREPQNRRVEVTIGQ